MSCALLVAEERVPGAFAIDSDRLGREHLLDDLRRPAREAKRREQSERDRVAVAERVAGSGLERMRKRVPEVEDRPPSLALVRIGEDDGGLERGAGAGSSAPREAPRAPRRRGAPSSRPRPSRRGAPRPAAWRGSEDRCGPPTGSGTHRRGSFPAAVLIPVLPPIAASTIPTRVVGTATHRTPRRCVAAVKPATSVVEPPPKPTIQPSRPSSSSFQSRSTTAGVFACSPAGTRCVVSFAESTAVSSCSEATRSSAITAASQAISLERMTWSDSRRRLLASCPVPCARRS